MTKTLRISALAAALSALPLTAAFALDRPPNVEEQIYISDALQFQGFTSWGEIEWDDGVWEVEDAIASDGQRHDIKLDQNFTLVSNEIDLD
jgi:hypothetical protein